LRAASPATFDTTLGSFKAELYLEEMPVTVSNFIDLANTGFYNGVHFHRVIKDFMLQFGCPNAKDPKSRDSGTGGPDGGSAFKNIKTGATIKRNKGGNIDDEHALKASNELGTLSMANTGDKHTGGSQFFINTVHNDFLDWFSPGDSKHPVFGKIVSGMEVVKKIEATRTDGNDNPVTPVMVKTVIITM